MDFDLENLALSVVVFAVIVGQTSEMKANIAKGNLDEKQDCCERNTLANPSKKTRTRTSGCVSENPGYKYPTSYFNGEHDYQPLYFQVLMGTIYFLR